jgi:hypothetical protein
VSSRPLEIVAASDKQVAAAVAGDATGLAGQRPQRLIRRTRPRRDATTNAPVHAHPRLHHRHPTRARTARLQVGDDHRKIRAAICRRRSRKANSSA